MRGRGHLAAVYAAVVQRPEAPPAWCERSARGCSPDGLAVPPLMGALSPTEVHTAWVAGAAAIKVFPASLARPGYLRELAGPFPDLRTVPSGGVAA